MTRYKRRRRQKRYRKIIMAGLLAAAASGCFLTRNSWKSDGSVRTGEQENPPVSVIQNDTGDEGQAAQMPETEAAWNLLLTNRWNPIPENYEVNLARLPGGEKVDKRIYEPLMEMLEAAKEGNRGELPKVVYGYRTDRTQQKLYQDKIEEYQGQGYSEEEAVREAEKWVAIPGTSEHQLGLAVDINGAVYDLYLWLQENSYKYGFIFRYPGDKTEITGIAEEVWHYRYVGVEAATEMYEQDLCLEEYVTQK